jgi:hypothetical protein
LIAEEVDKIDKRLATRNKNGEPEGVGWYLIVPLMIKEMQKLKKRVDELEEKLKPI